MYDRTQFTRIAPPDALCGNSAAAQDGVQFIDGPDMTDVRHIGRKRVNREACHTDIIRSQLAAHIEIVRSAPDVSVISRRAGNINIPPLCEFRQVRAVRINCKIDYRYVTACFYFTANGHGLSVDIAAYVFQENIRIRNADMTGHTIDKVIFEC